MFVVKLLTVLDVSLSFWVDFSLSALILTSLSGYILWFVRRKLYALPFFLLTLSILVNTFFSSYTLLRSTLLVVYLLFMIVFVVLNQTELKAQVDSLFSFKKGLAPTTQFDRDMIYDILQESVAYLSKNRIGGIITLERTTNLTDYIQNGKMINAPISADLIGSIFHPGTVLHDGAIIIRGSFMIAASVYFTPTTKPLNGNFGSRHRAAIGISEVTDAVTIVISEQTGKISIAYGGKLTAVYLDNFKLMLGNFMENRQS